MNVKKGKRFEYLENSLEEGRNIRNLLGPFTKALIIETPNGSYATDIDDLGVGGELRKTGAYGLGQIALIKNLLNNQSKILIIGAHIGTIAIPLAKFCSNIVAIEANPNSFKLLEINLKLNCIENCDAFNIAASEKFENISFLLNTNNSGGSKRKPLIDSYQYTYDKPKEIVVQAVPLDDYLTEKNFDIILMDIEGSEYFALKGMPNLLENSKTLIVEFLPHHLKNVSGISVNQFLSVLPHFDSLTIPSRKVTVNYDQIPATLELMYDNDIEDEALIFQKNNV